MTSVALRANRYLTWRRVFRTAAVSILSFAIAVVAVMVLRGFGVGPAASLLAAGRLHGRERLLVTDFAAGKDSSLSHVVTEAVRTNLGQSKAVSIMPPTAIAAVLARMQRPASGSIDIALGREIAIRDGVKALVGGSVTSLGSGYVISIRLVSADSGNDLAAFQKTVNGTSDLLDAIDDLTRKLRGRIGESLKSVRDAPALDQVTTSSIDALRLYAEATRASDLEGDYVKSEKLLREAVARDTMFAMAYRKLGVTLNNLSMSRAAIDSALSRAYQYRDRLPERERYVTIATYYQTGSGFDRQKAAEAWQQALAIDSTEVAALVNLANNYRSRRQLARAESLYAAVNASPRASQISWGNYAGTLLAEGKLAAADSAFAEVRRRFPNAQNAQASPAVMMYQRGQYDSVEAFWRARGTSGNPIVKLNGMANLVNALMLRGRMSDAQHLAVDVRALNAARGVPANPLADSINFASVQLWYYDRRDAAARALDAALTQTSLRSLPAEQRPYFTLAVLYARAARVDRAKSLIAQAESDLHGTSLLQVEAPNLHAALSEIAIAEHRPIDAVREVWKADSLPDGPVGDCVHCIDVDLGRAFDLANQPDSAIAHWEAYLSYPTHEPGRDAIFLPGIHKRLGELYEAKGETQKAISHYTTFIELWKNADKELQPKVAEARTRLAALEKRIPK
jgi:tetratricopeptide (TPR) repeat protein